MMFLPSLRVKFINASHRNNNGLHETSSGKSSNRQQKGLRRFRNMNWYRKLEMIGDKEEYYERQPMYNGLYDQCNNCPREKDPKNSKDVKRGEELWERFTHNSVNVCHEHRGYKVKSIVKATQGSNPRNMKGISTFKLTMTRYIDMLNRLKRRKRKKRFLILSCFKKRKWLSPIWLLKRLKHIYQGLLYLNDEGFYTHPMLMMGLQPWIPAFPSYPLTSI